MDAFVFTPTKANTPGYNLLLDGMEYCVAYETESHFIAVLGSGQPMFRMQYGLTAFEEKEGTLKDWIANRWSGQDIRPSDNLVGETVDSIWRPGLYYQKHTETALNFTEVNRREAEQSLRIILEKLDEILLYVEPSTVSLSAYGHKIRELLIYACTEVENSWTYYLIRAGLSPANGRSFTTVDYVKLLPRLFLLEYTCSLRAYPGIQINPFTGWTAAQPTQSLSWYDSYNKTKHNRTLNFSDATLLNAIQSVAGNLVMYIARFGPHVMFDENHTFNSLVNQHFKFVISNPRLESFYVPKIELKPTYRKGFVIYDSYDRGDLKIELPKPLII